jgi:hypothetical protein
MSRAVGLMADIANCAIWPQSRDGALTPRTTSGKFSGFAFGPFRLNVLQQTLWRENERVGPGNRSFGISRRSIPRRGHQHLISHPVFKKQIAKDETSPPQFCR